jgi:RNA polymerase sigma factor (sigma-70 family)
MVSTANPPPEAPRDPAAQRAERLSALFAEHNAALVQLLRVRLKSDQEARDVAQEAYLRLLGVYELGDVEHLRAYLFRTALNIATDRRRSEALRSTMLRDPMLSRDVDESSPDRAVEAVESLQAVERVLAALPARERYAFLLHRVAELHVDTIAQRLGVSRLFPGPS